ncbi:MAG: PAS domain-containing protein, partial [Candidatus Hodarchaeota archaeon]
MGLESLLKRDDIPFDVKETITKELHEIRRLQRELKKREEMYYSSVEDFKRTETALRESEEKYRNLIERANDGIAISQDYKLVFVNHRLAEILAYTVEELQGMPYNKTTHPDYTSEIDQRYEARLKGEETPSIYDTKLIRKDGTIVDVEFNSGAITYQGRPAAFTFIRDITERKKAEQALQQSEERLRAFIYSVTDSIDLWDSNLDLVDCNQAVIDKFPAGT